MSARLEMKRQRPLSRRLQARLMGLLNIPVRVLLRLPFSTPLSAFTGIHQGPDGRVDRGRLETAVKYGFRVVRWHLEKEVS